MNSNSDNTSDEFSNIQESKCRIPRNFIPKRYEITFYIDVINLTYSIKQEISIISNVNNPKYLTLNAITTNYSIQNLSLTKYDIISDTWIEISTNYLTKSPNPSNEIEDAIYIPIPNEVIINKDDELKFSCLVQGSISNKKGGFYFTFQNAKIKSLLSKSREHFMECYQNSILATKDKNEYLSSLVICSVNEPVYCREYMPCFDEPSYKAIFAFRAELDKFYVDSYEKLKCVSNGELIDVKEEGDKYLFSYSDSPLMSCYLFTFVIGNYDFIETINTDNIKIRVFTPLNRHHDGALAMTLAQKSLKFYQSFFNIPYYTTKLDLISVPEMSFRALENIGCIIFLDYAMLFGHFQSILERKFVSRTICHEISHTWFGNLVTMDWWNDIWLNEGFARIFEYICLTNIEEKDLAFWDNFIEYIYEKALQLDETSSTHPVINDVTSTKYIENVFDTISYAKGASVIRMLYYYVGEEKLKQSLNIYLNKYKYENTTTSMLWECFNEATNMQVDKLMNNWLTIPSHPVVSCSLEKIQDKWKLHLKQNSCIQEKNVLWTIPLFIKTKNNEFIKIMDSKETEFDIEKDFDVKIEELEKGANYIIINDQIKGFYRVEYLSDILIDCIISSFNKGDNISYLNIYSIISWYHSMKNLDKCIFILKKLKKVKNYLLLKISKEIFLSCFNTKYIMEGIEHLIESNEEREEYIKGQNEIYSTFTNLVEKDNQIIAHLFNKIFVYDEQTSVAYANQFNDEAEEIIMYFIFIVANFEDQEKIKKLLETFIKFPDFINKNLKFSIYQVLLKYCKILPFEQQKQIYEIIFKDYKDSYETNSSYIRYYFEEAITDVDVLPNELLDYLLETKTEFFYYNSKQTLKSSVKLMDALIRAIKKQYEFSLIDSKDKNESIIDFIKFQLQNGGKILFYAQFFRNIIRSFPNKKYQEITSKYYHNLLLGDVKENNENIEIESKYKFISNYLFNL